MLVLGASGKRPVLTAIMLMGTVLLIFMIFSLLGGGGVDPYSGLAILFYGPILIPPFAGYWMGYSIQKLMSEGKGQKLQGLFIILLPFLFYGIAAATKDIRVEHRKAQTIKKEEMRRALNEENKRKKEERKAQRQRQVAIGKLLDSQSVPVSLWGTTLYIKPEYRVSMTGASFPIDTRRFYKGSALKTLPVKVEYLNFSISGLQNTLCAEPDFQFVDAFWCDKLNGRYLRFEHNDLNQSKREAYIQAVKEDLDEVSTYSEQFIHEGDFGGSALKVDGALELYLIRRTEGAPHGSRPIYSEIAYWRATSPHNGDAQGKDIHLKCTKLKRDNKRRCDVEWALTPSIRVKVQFPFTENTLDKSFSKIRNDIEIFWELLQNKPADFKGVRSLEEISSSL